MPIPQLPAMAGRRRCRSKCQDDTTWLSQHHSPGGGLTAPGENPVLRRCRHSPRDMNTRFEYGGLAVRVNHVAPQFLSPRGSTPRRCPQCRTIRSRRTESCRPRWVGLGIRRAISPSWILCQDPCSNFLYAVERGVITAPDGARKRVVVSAPGFLDAVTLTEPARAGDGQPALAQTE